MTVLVWIGILLCISQSAMFSGLNLAYFSLSKLLLEMESRKGNEGAARVLALRRDSNFLLTTILWGNVAVNVLLALLSNSVLSGVLAFLFSTVVITLVGEIIPQAYCSRYALQAASFLSPVVRFYQIVLFPVAKPSAVILDKWLGKEAIEYIKEHDLRKIIQMHVEAPESDIERVEGKGALNFLAIDDIPVVAEGEAIDPGSIIPLEFENNRPVFPAITRSLSDSFLELIQSSGKKWVIVVDRAGEPRIALNSYSFLREALFGRGTFNPYSHCHRPIVVRSGKARLGEIIPRLKVRPEHSGDDVIDEDIIVLWNEDRRVITGSDILGRLLRGIVQTKDIPYRRRSLGQT